MQALHEQKQEKRLPLGEQVTDLGQKDLIGRGAWGWWRWGRNLRLLKALASGIESLDDKEDAEGQNNEVDEDRDERTKAHGNFRLRDLDGFRGFIKRADLLDKHELVKTKVDLGYAADERHDDVANHGVDNLAKLRTDDDAHGEVQHVALEGEIPKLLEKSHVQYSVDESSCLWPMHGISTRTCKIEDRLSLYLL